MNTRATRNDASRRTVLKGGTVVDSRGEHTADVAIENGTVVEVAASLQGDINVDATGCVVAPGFVDLHAHLREPGKEEAETIETGSRAGAKGGYTALVAMPNTDPAQDSVAVIDFVREQGKRAGLVEVVPSGCITLGRKGESLAPMAELAAAGVRIFTDDGNGVQDELLMRRAMEYGKGLDVTLAQHCEVATLTKGAVMNECQCCTSLGLPGWPSLAEELMVFRDIELARLTGARVHFLHLSTARSVELVRAAKRDGLPVTAEVTPHHLSLDETRLLTFDTVFKVNPPLRSPNDIAALREGVLDGTIDALATDHAPHPRRDKELSLDQAPPGMLGLETALGVALGVLHIDLTHLVRVMSINPAHIAGIEDRHGRDVQPGAPANLVVFDPNVTWQVEPEKLASKSRNTPYVGMTLRGKVRHTMFNGAFTVLDGEAQR
jgi:dihydroorotase